MERVVLTSLPDRLVLRAWRADGREIGYGRTGAHGWYAYRLGGTTAWPGAWLGWSERDVALLLERWMRAPACRGLPWVEVVVADGLVTTPDSH